MLPPASAPARVAAIVVQGDSYSPPHSVSRVLRHEWKARPGPRVDPDAFTSYLPAPNDWAIFSRAWSSVKLAAFCRGG